MQRVLRRSERWFMGRRGMASLPVVDLNDANNAPAALNEAFSTYGCCYVKGHGIDLEKEKKVMKAAHEVFKIPLEDKKRCERHNTGNGFIRGYIGLGGESGSELIEVKEAFSYGYEWDPSKPTENPLQGANVWPEATTYSVDHQSVLQSYFTDMTSVSKALCNNLSLALGQPKSYFGDYSTQGDTISIMRAFHYFPYDKLRQNANDTNYVGSSPHTDWGFLTLILQDPTGGLQFFHDNKWIDVPYVPGTIVVNGGDYLSLLTGGKWVSPVHRVVSENTSQERYSMVYFYYPDYDAKIPEPTSTVDRQNGIDSKLNTLVDGTHRLEDVSFGEYIASKWANFTNIAAMSVAQHIASTLQKATKVKHYTLAFLTREQQGRNEVLLGMKKRGFGAGKWNGFGGKVEATDATVADAAAREMSEEANVVVHGGDMVEKGTLVFTFTGKSEVMHVHVYQVTKYQGTPTETEEMRPQWYDYDAIPYNSMWSDDKFWLPSLLQGNNIIGQFDFDSDEAKIHHYVLDTNAS